VPLSLSVVTPERTVLERDDVRRITAPASEGQITILPRHAALMTSLGFGELTVVTPDGPSHMAVHGGFLQVTDDQVSMLADAAEHVEEIDEARARGRPRRGARRRRRGDRPAARAGIVAASAAASARPPPPRRHRRPLPALIFEGLPLSQSTTSLGRIERRP
jgi:F-type H+-transporting ATPase subunit epsilon